MTRERSPDAYGQVGQRKRQSGLVRRARASLRGVADGWRRDRAVRDLWMALAAGWTMLAVVGASPLWWALVVLASAAALGLEYLNTAVETLLDRIHPQHDAAIGRAKDLASSAALAGDIGAGGAILLALAFG